MSCRCGQTTASGETIGSVAGWTGEIAQLVKSPQAGRILAVRRLVSVQANDMVAVIGSAT